MTDHASFRRQAHEHRVRRIGDIKREHGGRADEKADARMIREAMAEHDSQLHPGHHTRLKLKDGGTAEGGHEHRRLDRSGRRRRDAGGGTDANDASTAAMTRAVNAGLAQNINPSPQQRARGGKTGKAGHVNVIVAAGGRDRPVPVPVPVGGGAPMAPRPPIVPPGVMGPGGPAMPPGISGGMPAGLAARPPMMPGPGGMPGGMPPVRARGGKIGKIDVGASSAIGRMEKAKMPIENELAAGD